MASRVLLAAAMALACAVVASGSRILAFLPMPARSHQAVFTPVLRELANRGHQVTAYVPYPMSDPPPTYKEILVPDVFQEMAGTMDITSFRKTHPVIFMITFFWMGRTLQEKICALESVKELVQSEEEFDAVILESSFIQESFSALQHKFGALSIELLPFGGHTWLYDFVGNPYNPAYMPDTFLSYSDSMTFMERLGNALSTFSYLGLAHAYYLPIVESLSRSCFDYKGSESRPHLRELMSNKSLVLENSHTSLNYAMAFAPNVINVAGLNLHPNKPLPKDIQQFMDEAKDGVIYFSLGSNIKVSDVVKDDIFKAFVSAFGKLKQRVLWKWEKDELPEKPVNVKISKWFPQQDILAHANCKLFITHGGYLSMTEAVAHGIPLIGIPFLADQPKNVKYATIKGYGLHLDYDNVTEQSVIWAVNEILSNPSYTEKAQERSRIFNDKPMSPLDKAVYWIEYAMRHKGAPHLRPALAKLPWYKSALLDVAIVVTAVLLAISLVIYFSTKKLVTLAINCVSGASSKSKSLKEKVKEY